MLGGGGGEEERREGGREGEGERHAFSAKRAGLVRFGKEAVRISPHDARPAEHESPVWRKWRAARRRSAQPLLEGGHRPATAMAPLATARTPSGQRENHSRSSRPPRLSPRRPCQSTQGQGRRILTTGTDVAARTLASERAMVSAGADGAAQTDQVALPLQLVLGECLICAVCRHASAENAEEGGQKKRQRTHGQASEQSAGEKFGTDSIDHLRF